MPVPAGSYPYYLERCSRCAGIWFDAGEWHRLASANLLEHLDEIWSPAWRRGLMAAESKAHLHQDLGAIFGAELLANIEALGDALAAHDEAQVALAYLRQRVLDGRQKAGG